MSSVDPEVQNIDTIWPNYGFKCKAEFDAMFRHISNGVFVVKPGKTLCFLHARITTGDRAQDLMNDEIAALKAGELWLNRTGQRITSGEFKCAASNCPNGSALHNAQVTAHVYSTQQLKDHPIEYMILIPTCSMCNNRGNTEKNSTCYPALEGEIGRPLVSRDDVPVPLIFIKISAQTAQGKGAAGKGTGKGSGKIGPPFVPPV